MPYVRMEEPGLGRVATTGHVTKTEPRFQVGGGMILTSAILGMLDHRCKQLQSSAGVVKRSDTTFAICLNGQGVMPQQSALNMLSSAVGHPVTCVGTVTMLGASRSFDVAARQRLVGGLGDLNAKLFASSRMNLSWMGKPQLSSRARPKAWGNNSGRASAPIPQLTTPATTVQGFGSFGTLGEDEVVTVDGSLLSERENIIAQVQQVASDWSSALAGLLNNQLSLSSVMFRNIFFVPQAEADRNSVQRAKTQLDTQFMPAAAAALRDPNRSLADVESNIQGYLQELAGQMNAAVNTEQVGRIHNIFAAMVQQLAVEGRDILDLANRGIGETLSQGVPWWILAAGGVFLFAYVARTIER